MKQAVRRANVFRNLQGIYDLTCKAMAAVTAEYWKKCIEHVKKEIFYYMYHDGLLDKDDANANEQIEMAEVPVVPAVPEVAEPIQAIQTIDDDMMVRQFLYSYNVPH